MYFESWLYPSPPETEMEKLEEEVVVVVVKPVERSCNVPMSAFCESPFPPKTSSTSHKAC
ncbi:hypothetical protein EYF80_028073 [Liparis tanakae]|uniref:Uncharacterized protein n=1 Tax=Liparis tanakae TaxID=230148 RepID=A0A4Z2H7T5_9TELE|nr:hypothetical protein EYF80_028073 [Liparis tanakae]